MKTPCEYSGGGTVLRDAQYDTVSAYDQGLFVDVCSLNNISKGIWIITAIVERSTSETANITARVLLGTSNVTPSFRGIGENGGTATTTTLVTVNADNSTIKLQAYAQTNISTNSKFRSTLQAYKLSD